MWHIQGFIHAMVVLVGTALTGLLFFTLPIALAVFAISWN